MGRNYGGPVLVLGALGALVLAACSVPVDPARIDRFAAAFSYVEQPEKARAVPFDHSAHMQVVDYKSRITIQPDQARLTELAAELLTEDQLPERLPRVTALLHTLPELIEAARAYVAGAQAADRAVANRPADPTPEQIEAIRKQITAQANVGLRVVDAILAIAEAEFRAEHGEDASEDAMIDYVDAITTPLLKSDDNERDVVLNLGRVETFLRERARTVLQAANDNAAFVEQGRSALLRIRASLRTEKGSLPLNVGDYDTIDNPKGTQSSRVGMMSAADRERVEEEYELASQTGRFLRDLRDDKSELRASVRRLRQDYESALAAVEEIDLSFLDESGRAMITAAADKLEEIARDELEPEVKRELAELRTLLGRAQELEDQVTRIQGTLAQIRDAGSLRSARDALQLFSAVSESVQRLGTDGQGLVRDVLQAATEVPGKLETLAGAYRTAVQARSEEVVQTAFAAAIGTIPPKQRLTFHGLVNERIPALESSFAGFVRTLRGYDKVFAVFAALGSTASGAALAEAADGIDPRVRKVPIDRVVPADIVLAGTPAEPEHEVDIRMELLTQDALGEETILRRAATTLDVQKVGLSSKVDAYLTFVKNSSSSAGRRQIDFEPFPSVSWELHYLPRIDQDSGFASRLWAVLDPGFGFNVATLQFDENVQMGIGAHISLFDGLLVGGYGVNLNVDQDADYIYLGIGLFELLEGTGLR